MTSQSIATSCTVRTASWGCAYDHGGPRRLRRRRAATPLRVACSGRVVPSPPPIPSQTTLPIPTPAPLPLPPAAKPVSKLPTGNIGQLPLDPLLSGGADSARAGLGDTDGWSRRRDRQRGQRAQQRGHADRRG